MTRDTVSDNMSSYLGAQARKEWTADSGLYEVETEIISRHFPPPPAHVLDIGCGAGRTTTGLEALGFDTEAIDLSQDLVDEAKRRVQRSRVQVMDARHLDFPGEAFDVAMFSFNGLDCLHPTSARREVLAEIWRVLRPGGSFYYSGHNGIGAWMPRPGDSVAQLVKRNRVLFQAQRRSFTERARYMAYPDAHGFQILYSAPPHVHVRELRELGFEIEAIYGSRSYRNGPHLLDDAAGSVVRLARISLTCPHLHYVVRKSLG